MINFILIVEDKQVVNELIKILRKLVFEKNILNFYGKEMEIFSLSLNRKYAIIVDEFFDNNLLGELVKKRQDILIIILSNQKEIPYYFKYHFFARLHLPIQEQELICLVQEIQERNNDIHENRIRFICNKSILYIKAEDIVSLYYENRRLYLQTVETSYQIKGNIKNHLYLCEHYDFRKCGRSKIINLKHHKV